MPRASTWLNAALLLLALVLGIAISQQRRDRTDWQQRASAAGQRLAERRNHLAQPAPPKPPPTETLDPRIAAAAREVEQLNATREQRAFRLNALHNYTAALDAMHLPPLTFARAREIILAQWQAAADARQGVRSFDEAIAASHQAFHEKDAELIALLGRDGFESLEASKLEDHIAWEIGTDLWDGGAPLSPEQLHALAVAQVRTNYEQANWFIGPNEAQAPDPQTGLSRQDSALLRAVETSLSPRQVDLLRQNLIDDNRYNTAMRISNAKQQELWRKAK